MGKPDVAIVAGTGFEKLFKDFKQQSMETPYGPASLFMGAIDNHDVVFLPRHGVEHSVPPHKVNHRANVYALHDVGVRNVLATNAVGAINPRFKPGDIVVPDDLVDFTKCRPTTFYDDAPVTHIDFSQPFCPKIRKLLVETARRYEKRVWDKAVLVCTEGPRFETPAEIAMFRKLGCDVVGMTTVPEAVLARELEMCYANVCYVSNMAAGMQKRLIAGEVSKASKKVLPSIESVLIETVKALSVKSKKGCPCASAVREARLK